MARYYRTYNAVFEDVGNNTLRCIASYRENMVGIILVNYNKSELYPHESKEMAMESLKEDAYWDNAIVWEGEQGK